MITGLMVQQIILALLVAAVLVAASGRTMPRWGRGGVLILALLALPLLGVLADYWWVAWWPGFSVSTLVLLLWWWQQRLMGEPLVSPGQWRFSLWLLLLLGILLMLGERLGLDLYSMGYGNFKLSTGLLLLGLAIWVCRLYWSCLLLVLVQGSYALGLLGSDNLWDYLLDPWLLVGIGVWMVTALAGRGRRAAP